MREASVKVNVQTPSFKVPITPDLQGATVFRSAILTVVSVAALGHLTGCAGAARRGTQPGELAPAGTYSLMVCRGPCGVSGSEVVAEGTLVLETQPYSTEAIPQPARGYFEKYPDILLHQDARDAPNACFAFSRSEASTLAGTTRAGLTRWTPAVGDTISVRLYHSADAGYDVRLSARSGTLTGSGQSWGPWDESRNSPPNGIIGRRIGPPDRTPCIRAAEARLEALQR